jgi:hypothetical protein
VATDQTTARSSGIEREFAAIDLLIGKQDLQTAGVDAFALSTIKVERQIRRLFTFGVYRLPCFNGRSAAPLVQAMVARRIYLPGLVAGFNWLHRVSVADLVGPAAARLLPALEAAREYRNKIFHGQLTGDDLSRDDLLGIVADLRTWSGLLAKGAQDYMGYEGFGNSVATDSTVMAPVPIYRRDIVGLLDYGALLFEMEKVKATATLNPRAIPDDAPAS